jgi:hypothetical protein
MSDEYEHETQRRATERAVAEARHAANLTVVDALLALEGEASPAPWRAMRVATTQLQGTDVAELQQVSDVPDRGFYLVASGSFYAPNVAIAAALRNGARDALQARRRMLERHRPDITGSHIECSHCFDAQENTYAYPCPDYVDLEAGLVMPHRVLVSVDEDAQLAAVACGCCGWSKTFGHLRRGMGAVVAERLAEVWGQRHLAGDPDAQLGTEDTSSAVPSAGDTQ